MRHGLIGALYMRWCKRRQTRRVMREMPEEVRGMRLTVVMVDSLAVEIARLELMLLRSRAEDWADFVAHCVRRWTIDLIVPE